MPNLKHLLEELEELGVEPKTIRIPGQLYSHASHNQRFVMATRIV